MVIFHSYVSLPEGKPSKPCTITNHYSSVVTILHHEKMINQRFSPDFLETSHFFIFLSPVSQKNHHFQAFQSSASFRLPPGSRPPRPPPSPAVESFPSRPGGPGAEARPASSRSWRPSAARCGPAGSSSVFFFLIIPTIYKAYVRPM